ncbi:hypothetical protein VTI74DRAFT_4006 [Chaetomium olivicolor]
MTAVFSWLRSPEAWLCSFALSSPNRKYSRKRKDERWITRVSRGARWKEKSERKNTHGLFNRPSNCPHKVTLECCWNHLESLMRRTTPHCRSQMELFALYYRRQDTSFCENKTLFHGWRRSVGFHQHHRSITHRLGGPNPGHAPKTLSIHAITGTGVLPPLSPCQQRTAPTEDDGKGVMTK